MLQQLIAIILLVGFIYRLTQQFRKDLLPRNEFIFWLVFWSGSLLMVIFLKPLDALVNSLGFSGTAIEELFYFGTIILFYLIFRLRLRLANSEKRLARLISDLAITESTHDR